MWLTTCKSLILLAALFKKIAKFFENGFGSSSTTMKQLGNLTRNQPRLSSSSDRSQFRGFSWLSRSRGANYRAARLEAGPCAARDVNLEAGFCFGQLGSCDADDGGFN